MKELNELLGSLLLHNVIIIRKKQLKKYTYNIRKTNTHFSLYYESKSVLYDNNYIVSLIL